MLTKKRKVIYSLLTATLLTTSIGHAENFNSVNVNYNSNYSGSYGNGYTINYNNNSYKYNNSGINKYPNFIWGTGNKPAVKPGTPVTKPGTPVERPDRPVTKPDLPVNKPEVPSIPTPDPKPTPTPPPTTETPPISGLSATEMEVVRLVNIERQKGGLAPFTASSELSNVARKKSEDMAKNNYFSHTSPTYGSPFDMMKSFGIKYNTAGENIAKGQATAQSVVTGWMNSPGHRDNIMNPKFNKIGVGLYKSSNGTNLWTQMFTN